MTTIPRNAATNHNANARAYLVALADGTKPSVRPEIDSFWQEPIEVLERAYDRSKGDTTAMQRALAALSKQNPALADLLAPATLPLQGKIPMQAPQIEEVSESNDVGMPVLPEAARLAKGLSKGACPELDIYEAYSKKASPEAYDDFHCFCGLWGFSTVAARRVHLQLGPKKFYTNLYFTLCARTTLIAKTETADIAKRMLIAAGMGHLLLGDRLSPQKFMSDMSGSFVPANYTDLDDKNKEKIRRKLSMPGQRAWFYDEFGKFVQSMLRKGSNTTDFAELFLRLDKCPDEYENSTISRGSEPIENPYLTLLGTMTPSNIRESAKCGGDFWTDGFWARFSFLTPPPNFFKTETWGMEPLPIPESLTTALKEWHERLGVPTCSVTELTDKKGDGIGKFTIERSPLPETSCSISVVAYEAYNNYRIALRGMTAQSENQDLDGSYGRLPETAMRMAIIMASLSNNNRIEMRHWARAQELAETLRKNLHELYSQVNTPVSTESQASLLEDEIIKHMSKPQYATGMTINVLRTSYMKKCSSKQLEEVLEAMKRSGAVEEFKTNHAKKYKLRKDSTDEQ